MAGPEMKGQRAVGRFPANRLHVLVIAAVVVGAVDVNSVTRAADMPVKARPLPAPARSWDGCYAGGQLGAAYGQSDWRYDGINPYSLGTAPDTTFITEEHFRQFRAAVGAQVGCNFSYGGPWMLGMEAGLIATPMDRAKDNALI